MTPRRLSQAISEGDGISLIVPVASGEAARAAEEAGAEALCVSSSDAARLGEIRAASGLPVLVLFNGERASELAGADACIVDVPGDDLEWLERVHRELGDDYELALRITDDERLRFVLEHFDPEILVLAVEGDGDGNELERVLALLPDVPAGKLAIADLAVTARDEVDELERAGVDAVIVGAGNVAALVGAAPPEV